jgi:hypothetical protein
LEEKMFGIHGAVRAKFQREAVKIAFFDSGDSDSQSEEPAAKKWK